MTKREAKIHALKALGHYAGVVCTSIPSYEDTKVLTEVESIELEKITEAVEYICWQLLERAKKLENTKK